MNRFFTLLLAVLFAFTWSFAQDEIEETEHIPFWNILYQPQANPIVESDYPVANTSFEWLHPSPQGNDLRWVKAFDENNWYAVGYAGTFMKTSDAGANWTIMQTINGVSSSGSNYILYGGWFFDLNNGLVCGSGGRIYRTTDAGATWDSVGVAGASAASWYAMYFVDNNLGFVSGTTSGRLAMTTDGGLTWTANGTIPSGTYYNVYAVDSDTIIVSSSSGNIRRSTDAGVTWATINVGFSSTLYGLNFTDPMNGWVSGSSSHAAYTTDNGLTWTDVSAGLETSTYYEIDFVQSVAPSTLPLQGFEDVTFPPAGWHTKNVMGTKVWGRSTSSFHTGSASALSAYELSGGEDWLVTPMLNIVSGDSLSFWARRVFSTTYDPDTLQILVSTTDTSIASFTNEIFKGDVNAFSTTWDKVAIDLSSYAGMSVYIAFRHYNTDGNGVYLDDIKVDQNTDGVLATTVYLTGEAFYLQKTTDMGTTWEDVYVLDPAQTWTGSFYATDFIDDTSLVTVGDNGMIIRKYESVFGGEAFFNWIKAGILYDIWAESKVGRVIAVGAPGIAGTTFDQAMFSPDGGATWSLSTINGTPDEDFNGISMINNTTGWICGDEGGIWKTTDGGITWDSLFNHGVNLEKICFTDANTGYTYGSSGSGFKTTDGGLSWTTLTTGHGTSLIYDCSFIDNMTGITIGATGKVYKTTDGGATTTQMTVGTTTTLYAGYMLDANHAWVAGSGGVIRRTTDGGTSWDTIDVAGTIYSIEFRDPMNGAISGLGGTFYKTSDGGTTWEFENSGASATLYSLSLENTSPDTAAAFIVGSNGYILKNANVVVPVELAAFSASVNGNNVTLNWKTATELNNSGFEIERKETNSEWTKLVFINGNGTTTQPRSYSYTDSELPAGEYAYRIKQIDYNGTFTYYNLSETVIIGAPKDYELAQNYPNPFNPSTKIVYAVPFDGDVNVSIFNLLGEKVATLVNGFVKAGTYEVNFNAGKLASGVYLYRMESNNFVSVKKMMILK